AYETGGGLDFGRLLRGEGVFTPPKKQMGTQAELDALMQSEAEKFPTGFYAQQLLAKRMEKLTKGQKPGEALDPAAAAQFAGMRRQLEVMQAAEKLYTRQGKPLPEWVLKALGLPTSAAATGTPAGGKPAPPPPAAGAAKKKDPPPWARPILAEAAARTGLPEELLAAVIQQESGFNPGARSRTGALGLMQLMPGTARALGVRNPLDPRENVLGGAQYLQQQLARFGRLDLALAAYNAGPAAVQQYGGIPPFAETQKYVQAILGQLSGGTVGAVARSGERLLETRAHARAEFLSRFGRLQLEAMPEDTPEARRARAFAEAKQQYDAEVARQRQLFRTGGTRTRSEFDAALFLADEGRAKKEQEAERRYQQERQQKELEFAALRERLFEEEQQRMEVLRGLNRTLAEERRAAALREAEAQGPDAERAFLSRRAAGLQTLLAEFSQAPPDTEQPETPEEAARRGQRLLETRKELEAITKRIGEIDLEQSRERSEALEAERLRLEALRKAMADLAGDRRELEEHAAEAQGPGALLEVLRKRAGRTQGLIDLLGRPEETGRPETPEEAVQREARVIQLKRELVGLLQRIAGLEQEIADTQDERWENEQKLFEQAFDDFKRLEAARAEIRESIARIGLPERELHRRDLQDQYSQRLFDRPFRELDPSQRREVGGFVSQTQAAEAKKEQKGAALRIAQQAEAVAQAIAGVVEAFKSGKNKVAAVLAAVMQAIASVALAMNKNSNLAWLGPAGAVVGIIGGLFSHDSPMQDSKARRWGFDFGTAFSQGARDAAQGPAVPGLRAGGAGAVTVHATQNIYGPINSQVDLARSYEDLGYAVSRTLRTAGAR
ncbi:MAG TPA: transglycosylase SLT domain-containing protein, partial [Armatimonadota bacterium]|nr:transglycosylase SLT domain-containing protein [Armatimonadota bacterium]